MNKSTIISSSLIGLTIIAGLALTSTHTYADDTVVSNASVTVPISCMMTGTVNTAHNATINAGTYSGTSTDYANGIGKTTLTAYCNDNNGFSIYAIGFTGDEYGTTTLVGQNTNLAINTKVYESTDTTSNWSMKVTKVNDSTQSYNPTNMSITNSFDNWHVIPDTYTQVAQYKATSGSSTTDQGQGALGAKVETTYATYIAPTQAADTYTGQVKFTMVHPYDNTPADGPILNCPAAAICYSRGASDAVGTMANQTNATDGSSVTLYPSNFSRDGYGFAGWADKYDYLTNPSTHFYGPNETITVPEGTTTNGFPLYAVWIASTGNLQDSTKVATLCGTGTGSLTQAPTDGTANLSSVTALTDQRDNQTYAIAKLADGNCWMIENLRLEAESTRGATNITLSQGYNSSFTGLADPESTNFSDTTVANSLYSIDGSTENTISGNYKGYRFPRYNNSNTQQRGTNTSALQNIYSNGNLYTWHATIADTTQYSSGDHDTTSICPNGWKIPTGNTTTVGYGALDVAMGGTGGYQSTEVASNRWRKYPNNFLFPGYYNGSSIDHISETGYYWSSTPCSNGTYSYVLKLDNPSGVAPGTSTATKNLGNPVRCMISIP